MLFELVNRRKVDWPETINPLADFLELLVPGFDGRRLVDFGQQRVQLEIGLLELLGIPLTPHPQFLHGHVSLADFSPCFVH